MYDLTTTSVDTLINSSVDSNIVVNKYRPKLSTAATVVEDEEPIEALVNPEAPVPIPKITSFTNDGLMTITFSEPMTAINIGDILRQKVALRLT